MLAVFLLVLGAVLLVLGSLLLAGVVGKEGTGGKAAPLIVIGAICFIPGLYNVRLAYYSWKGYHGYSYSDIPNFDEEEEDDG